MSKTGLMYGSYEMGDYSLTTEHSFLNHAYILRVKDLPSDEKPREKLLQLGPHELTLSELIAILWGFGTKKEELLLMAKRLTKEYGEKALLAETSPQKLSQAFNIPLLKACQVVVGFELGRRYFSNKGGRKMHVRNAKQAYKYFSGIGESKKEQLRGIYLNSRYQVIHDEVISVGTLTSNLVHSREVFQPAIEHTAAAVIIAHNHPSGVAEPTNADVIVTEQLLRAGKILGIELLDHLVITSSAYVSVMDCTVNNDES